MDTSKYLLAMNYCHSENNLIENSRERIRPFIEIPLDFSYEINILINKNGFLCSNKSLKIYPINQSSYNNLYFEKCLFHKNTSEQLIIQFCLDNDIFMVSTHPRRYDLFKKINKLREDEQLNRFLILISPDQFCSNGKEHLNKIAIIGGTFHAFHRGHSEYIDLAFKFADKVHLLLSSDNYARTCKPYKVKSYNDRKNQLQEFLINNNYIDRCNIIEINSEQDIVNFCLNNEISLSVVIPEYYPLFERINRLRDCQGLSNLLILVKQRTLNSNGFDINSTIEDRFSSDISASSLKAIWEN